MPDTSDNESEASSTKTNKVRRIKSAKKSKKTSKNKPTSRVIVSAEQLPRKSLEQSLMIAKLLREVFAGGPATWDQIAQAMGVAPKNPNNKYPYGRR